MPGRGGPEYAEVETLAEKSVCLASQCLRHRSANTAELTMCCWAATVSGAAGVAGVAAAPTMETNVGSGAAAAGADGAAAVAGAAAAAGAACLRAS